MGTTLCTSEVRKVATLIQSAIVQRIPEPSQKEMEVKQITMWT
jgi:hypothetical protein